MPDSCQLPLPAETTTPSITVGSRLRDALVARDFGALAAFQRWFGAARGFEVVDTTVDEVGDREHVSWRLRVHPTALVEGAKVHKN